MIRKFGLISLSATLFIFLIKFFTPDAHAIPAFARKYKTSCITCHIAYPKLTPFGEAFRRNGFQFPEGADIEYIKEEPVNMGAETYKRVFPKAIWPGQIPGTTPLAFRFEGEYNITPNEDVTNDFRVPLNMTLATGGTLGENISFYSDIHLFDQGAIGFLNRAYLQFSNLLDRWVPPSALNVKVGQFTIAADPFSMHRDIFTRTPIAVSVYSPQIGSNLNAGHHGTPGSLELTQRGLEVDGVLKHRFTYALGIANGNGINAADHNTGKFDNNSMKDVYFRLAYKLGGMGLDGYTGKAEESFTERSEYWIDNSIRIGVFGYRGDTATKAKPVTEVKKAPSKITDEVHTGSQPGVPDVQTANTVYGTQRIGFDLSLYYQSLNLFGAALLAKDDMEVTNNNPSSVIWFAESDYVFYPWLIGALRYDMVFFKSGKYSIETKNAKRLVPHLTIMPRANMKLILESLIDLDNTDNVNIIVGLDYAF